LHLLKKARATGSSETEETKPAKKEVTSFSEALEGRHSERWIYHLLEDQYKLETAPKKTEVTSVSEELLNNTTQRAEKVRGYKSDFFRQT